MSGNPPGHNGGPARAFQLILTLWLILVAAGFLSGEHRLADLGLLSRAFFPFCLPAPQLALARLGSLAVDCLLVILMAAASLGSANSLLDWLGIRRQSRPVRLCLGYGGAALVWLGIGLAGLWFRPVALALLAAMALAPLKTFLPAFLGRWRGAISGISPYWILAVPPLLVTLFGAMTPETAFDPLRCHLGLPKIFGRAHKVFLPENLSFASYPLNASMLFGWLRELGGDSAAKLFNWHLLPLLMALTSVLTGVLRHPPKSGGGAAGVAAGLAVLAVPLVWLQSSKAFAELLMAVFVVAALIYAIDSGIRRRRSAVLAGIFMGLALGTKYTAVNALIPLFILLAVRGRIRVLALAAAVSLAVAGPWLARNFLGEGNPVHPLFSAYFYGTALAAPSLARPHLAPGGLPAGGLPGLIAAPWNKFMSGSFSDTYPPGAAVLAMLPVLLLARGRAVAVAVFASIFLLDWAGLTGGLGRYLVAVLPALFAVTVPALLPGVRGWAVWASALAVFIPGAMLGAHSVVVRQDPLPFASGCIDRGEFLSLRIPDNLRIMGLVSGKLLPGEKFYSYGELATYYARPEGVSEFEEDRPLVRVLAGMSFDAGDLAKKFRQRRISAVLYNQSGGMTQTAVSGAGPWPVRDLMVWQEFLRTRSTLLTRWEEPGRNVCVSLFGLARRPDARGRLASGVIWPHLPAAEGILDAGDRAMNGRDWRGAERIYRDAARKYPGYAWAWQRLAESLKAQGRKDEAGQCAARARKLGVL